MLLKEQVVRDLDSLSESELAQVANYLSFLKYKSRLNAIINIDESKLAALYAEFADEDRELAEAGMGDYVKALMDEDRL